MSLNIRSFIRDLAGNLFYASGITQPSNRNKCHPFSIVTFHRVLPADLLRSYPMNGIAVTPGELEWFVRFFKKYFVCGSLSENIVRWQSGEYTKRPLLSITFDDGQLDNFLYARPILKAAKIPATFFVVTNGVEYNDTLWYDRLAYAIVKLSEQKPMELQHHLQALNLMATGTIHEIASSIVEQAKIVHADVRLTWLQELENAVGGVARPNWDGMMNWRQLAVLAQEGHEIGCHSMTHPILPLCSNAELQEEIISSRKILQENLDTPISSFCYPNGDADERTTSLLKKARYSHAVTTQWGANKQGVSRFMLKRFDIQSQTSRSRKGYLSKARLSWRLSPFFPKRM